MAFDSFLLLCFASPFLLLLRGYKGAVVNVQVCLGSAELAYVSVKHRVINLLSLKRTEVIVEQFLAFLTRSLVKCLRICKICGVEHEIRSVVDHQFFGHSLLRLFRGLRRLRFLAHRSSKLFRHMKLSK